MAGNEKILNAIREVASAEYKDRIPTATQTNLGKIADILSQYPTQMNEFMSVFTNKIAREMFFQKSLVNKLKLFNRGKLSEVGNTIESVFVDIVKGKDFSENFGKENTEVGSLLGKEDSNVKVEYYNNECKNKYKVTISKPRLKSALTTVNGLQNLINSQLQSALSSKEYDEYLIMLGLLNKAWYKEIVKPMPVDETSSKQFVKTLISTIERLSLPSKVYNKQGVTTFSRANDLVLITTPEIKAELDVEVMAMAFNINKVEIPSRIITVDSFEDADRYAVLIDKDMVQFYVTLEESAEFNNADKLTTNVFYHYWILANQCHFANSIEFRTKAKTQA